jgi:hypothetical protein
VTHEGPVVIAARIRAELSVLDEVLVRASEAGDAISSAARPQFAVDSAALNVHDLYVGIERLLETIADNVDRSIPDGRHWHRDLLQQMTLPLKDRRPPVLSAPAYELLTQLLGFRHVVRNVYTYQLRSGDVLTNVQRAAQAFPVVRAELNAFADWLESISADD